MTAGARATGSPRVLVVEDEPSAAAYLRLALEEDGHRVRTARNGVEALVALERETFELVVSDLRMPRMDGLELLAHLRQRWPEIPAIVVTANDDVSDVVEAVQLGAVNYLVKPVGPAVLTTAVRKALRARPAVPARDAPLSEIVGESKAIVEVRHQIALAARSDVHVLITGETGTGKELVAREIHRASNAGDGPFVAHNCSVSPRDLFESEFFGHRRGAFTGAERDHVGLLARAHGGVLFLDELETLEPLHQAKLLRVLDDGLVRPIGSEQVRQVSVRFLAATNRDPREMIEADALREDLYYRLRGFEIALPPLRERREDIPLLAAHFLGRDDPGCTPEALDALARAAWPGNVRELRNALRSARASAGGTPIAPRHLPPDAPIRGPRPEAVAELATLREIERSAIARAMDACDGNRTRAAQLLGIDRSTLRRKLREFELDA